MYIQRREVLAQISWTMALPMCLILLTSLQYLIDIYTKLLSMNQFSLQQPSYTDQQSAHTVKYLGKPITSILNFKLSIVPLD